MRKLPIPVSAANWPGTAARLIAAQMALTGLGARPVACHGQLCSPSGQCLQLAWHTSHRHLSGLLLGFIWGWMTSMLCH